MNKFTYDSIERVKQDWFIVRFKNRKYILVGKSELESILVNGLVEFLNNTMITIFNSKKSLIERFKSEPFYKHLFS